MVWLTLRRPLGDDPQALAFSRVGEIAQLVEHTTENRGVPGSSPGLAIVARPANPELSGCAGKAQDHSKRRRRPFPAFSMEAKLTVLPRGLGGAACRSVRPTRASRAAGGVRSRRADGAGAHIGIAQTSGTLRASYCWRVDGTRSGTLAAMEGRLKRIEVPPPGRGAATMAPPCASMIFRHTARPMPQPS